jgi:hypothetical protein
MVVLTRVGNGVLYGSLHRLLAERESVTDTSPSEPRRLVGLVPKSLYQGVTFEKGSIGLLVHVHKHRNSVNVSITNLLQLDIVVSG